MIDKSEFRKLYEKLKNNTISEVEFKAFLRYTSDTDYEVEVKKLLDQEATERYSKWSRNVDKTRKSRIWASKSYAVAASVLLLIGVLGVLWIYFFQTSAPLVYATTNGEIEEIWLPDSSFVKLNANSTLEWMESRKKGRVVRLSGEAFFEVRHTVDDRAFSVMTDQSRITVLGTSFNVNSRENDRIYLEEGSIRLEKVDMDHLGKVLLKPGESAIVVRDTAQIVVAYNKIVENEAAWKDGLLRFSDVRLSTIVQRLEEIYGKDIRVENSQVLEAEMEFTLPYANWEVTGQALALAVGLELEERGDYAILK